MESCDYHHTHAHWRAFVASQEIVDLVALGSHVPCIHDHLWMWETISAL